MKKRVLVLLLKYGLGFGVLAYLLVSNWHIMRDGRDEGLATVLERPFDFWFFLLSFVLCLASTLLTFVRWHILVRAQDLPFTMTSAVRLGFVGTFTSTFLPGSVGGDIIKAAFLCREQQRRTVAVATVLADRLIGLFGLIWVTALLGGVFWSSGQLEEMTSDPEAILLLESIIWTAGILAGASIVVWVVVGVAPDRWIAGIGNWLARCPKVGGTLRELWGAVWLYRRHGARSVILALVLSMVGHIGFFMTFYFAARTVFPGGDIPSFTAHLLIVPVGATVQGVFPAPGGMGGGELIFGLLYRGMGFPAASGVLASLLKRSIDWALGFVGYFVYLGMRSDLPAAPRVEAPDAEKPPANLDVVPNSDA